MLGVVAGGVLLLIGLRLVGLAIDYGWDGAIEQILSGAIGDAADYRVSETGELVASAEAVRTARFAFAAVLGTLAVVMIGSFFSFRWASARTTE